jgi:uncharacterized membrane protein
MGHLLDVWSALYANHPALRTLIDFMHVGGLLAGGGCAVAADLATLRAGREGPAAQRTQLVQLHRIHRIVLLGLALVTISGLLLFAADVETYVFSKVFWLKMALVTALLLNGVLLQLGERRATRDIANAWPRLRRTAIASLCLWFLTTLAGAALPNIG